MVLVYQVYYCIQAYIATINKKQRKQQHLAKGRKIITNAVILYIYITFKRIKYILLQRKIMCVSVRLIETQKNNQYIQLIHQFITHQTYIYIYIYTQKYKLVTIDKEKKII